MIKNDTKNINAPETKILNRTRFRREPARGAHPWKPPSNAMIGPSNPPSQCALFPQNKHWKRNQDYPQSCS